jgi:nucleotide-binding universal stress UspA family protein
MTNHASPFRSILVPLDGSDLAAQALPLAATIARRSGGQLRLALVHEHPAIPLDAVTTKTLTSMDLAAHKAERAYLRGVRGGLREDGIRVASAVTLTGTVGPALVTYARDLGIDLVVMATHGRGGFRRIWLGSTADHLVRQLDIPVLLVRPAPGQPAESTGTRATKVLVPLDGSSLAEEALGPAGELARIWNADLHLVRVIGPVVSADPLYPVSIVYDEELTSMARAAAQAYLDKVIHRLGEQGLRATGAAIIGGNTAHTIQDAAHAARVVALAIATHGRTGLGRAVLGSVADKLVRGAEVPVLVWRPTGQIATTPRASRRTRARQPRRARALP